MSAQAPTVPANREPERLPMRRPLVPVAISFASGIWLADVVGVGGGPAWAVAACCLALVCVLARLRMGGPLRFLGWLVVVAAIGWARGGLPAQPLEAVPETRAVLEARALSGWQAGTDHLRLDVEARSLRLPGAEAEPLGGRVRLTVLTETGPCPLVLPGDGIRVWTRLQEPLDRHNPGTRNPSLGARRRGIQYTGFVSGCDRVLVEPGRHGGGVVRLAERARNAVREHLDRTSDDDATRALFAALTIGDATGIPTEIRSRFQRAGLAHLLAVSGLHLACVAFGFYWLLVGLLARLRFLSLRLDVRRLAAGIGLPMVGFYVLLAGAGLPALRAGVAVACFLVAVLVRRRPDPYQTLAAAGLVVLGAWPQSLFEVSFQLSFSAVTAILLLAPAVCDRLGVPWRLPLDGAGWLQAARTRSLQLLAVSFAATLGTAPLVAMHFHQVSLVGLVANLVAVPLAAWIIVPLGLAMAACLPLGAWLAGLFSGLGLWLCGLLIGWAGLFSAPDWTALWVAGPTGLELVAWYAGLVLLARWSAGRLVRIGAALAGLALVVSWGWGAIAPKLDDSLRLTVLDVGQGDSLLVELPGGQRLLVDGGGSYSGRFDTGRYVVAPALWARGVSRLDAVVVTHRDADHAGGLASIVQMFRPREVWTASDLTAADASLPIAVAARRTGAHIRRLGAGDRPVARGNLAVDVLWPPDGDVDLDENERSLVLRLRLGERALLLTGDLEREGERGLLARSGVDLGADVLKVGHHGSKHATSLELLKRVRPTLALVSVGRRNRFGLPHPEVLERLAAAKVRLLRSDVHGAVCVSTDGVGLEVEPALVGPAGAGP